MTAKWAVDLAGIAETEAFGQQLAQYLFPGAIVALIGPLGAGKTHLTRALALGLGITDPHAVTSPTFVLIQEYPAALPIYHFDAYRLRGEAEFEALGVDEYFHAAGVCIVEWADRVPHSMPHERLEIRIAITGETTRHLELTAYGERYHTLLIEIDGAL